MSLFKTNLLLVCMPLLPLLRSTGASASPLINVVPDGGFESEQWTLAKWDRGEAEASFSQEGRTGQKAAKLTGISSEEGEINILAYSPPINVHENRDYVVSAWFRTKDDAIPMLTVHSFKENWELEKWNTPKTNTLTRGLTNAGFWTCYTWHFRTVPDTVQVIIIVRNIGVGTVWFDDVGLYEREMNYLQMKIVEKGTITTFPDNRRSKFDIIASDSSASWNLTLIESNSGRLLASGLGTGSNPSFVLNYTASQNTELTIVVEEHASCAVLAKKNYLVPPPMSLELIPSYRNSVFLSQTSQTIPARLICNFDTELMHNMRFAVQPQSFQAPIWQSMKPVNDLNFPLSPEVETMTLNVLLQGVPNYETCSIDIKIIEPTEAEHEVVIGKNNEILVDGNPFFPSGFYSPQVGPSFDAIAEAGYTAALTYSYNPQSCKEWLDDCQRLGLLGIVSIPRPFVQSFNESELREAIRVVKQHPALLAYYIFDEPSPNKENQTPDDLKRVYDVVADEDPYHPIALCIWNSDWFRLFIDSFDILMTDPYPLLNIRQPLTKISRYLDEARDALDDRKPVWVVPQAFGWDVIENIPEVKYVTPTPEQERSMTYLGLTHGPSAVVYYSYHTYTTYDTDKAEQGLFAFGGSGFIPEYQPKLWSALVPLGSELSRLGPALLLPEAREGVVGSVHWRLTPSDTTGCAWLIAVNTNEEATANAALPFDEAMMTQVVFGNGTISKEGANALIALPPLGTLAVCATDDGVDSQEEDEEMGVDARETRDGEGASRGGSVCQIHGAEVATLIGGLGFVFGLLIRQRRR